MSTTSDDKPTRTHRDFPVWQQAMALAEAIYELSERFAEDDFGLGKQLRRTVVSIPSSIAEGSARSSTGELGHYLGVALGGIATLETELELAKRFDLIDDADGSDDATALLESVRKQLIVFRRSLKS